MNPIKIFKGDDTNFNEAKFLTINLTTEIDIAGFIGIFKLGDFEVFSDISSKSMQISIPAYFTSQMPLGTMTGVFKLCDTKNRFQTVSNTIPFLITSEVFTPSSDTVDLPIPPNYPVQIELVYGTQTGTTDYNELQNIPTFENIPLKGNLTHQALNIAPLDSLDNLIGVVNQKANTADVQNALNNVGEETSTLQKDLGDLGNQVHEIEAKIPEAASAENPLVSKSEMNTAIANAGGGDVDLSGYLQKSGGTMSGALILDNSVQLQFKSGMYTGTISQGSIDHIMQINPHGGYLNVLGRIRNGNSGKYFLDEGAKGTANGIAPLNANSKIDSQYIISEYDFANLPEPNTVKNNIVYITDRELYAISNGVKWLEIVTSELA